VNSFRSEINRCEGKAKQSQQRPWCRTARLNSQPRGGYLIYRWYLHRQGFVDGQIDMYGPDIVRAYTQVMTLKPERRDVLRKYEIRTVLIPKDSALSTRIMTWF
jgi:hypothetical protein